MLDKRYQTLDLIAQTRSFTKAAEKLFITQPAVSQQIRSLETELGFPLITKVHNHIEMTPAGQSLADYAHQVQLESTKVLKQVHSTTDQRPIRLGCTLSLSSSMLPQLVTQLSTMSPLITTQVANTGAILSALRNGTIDFGLVEGNFNKEEFDAIHILDEPFVGVTSAHHPLARLPHVTLDDLIDVPLLIRESGSGTRNIFANWLATQNYRVHDFHQIIEIGNPSPIIKLLLSGFGVSFMYRSLVHHELKNGQLIELPVTDFSIQHPINLVYLKDSYFVEDYQQIATLIQPSSFTETRDRKPSAAKKSK